MKNLGVIVNPDGSLSIQKGGQQDLMNQRDKASLQAEIEYLKKRQKELETRLNSYEKR